ncbi:MAG: DUF1565 domain-containing protein [Verrucomicrobiae bacterium]|nr:DUF1565 domain-containing protein [Verrucomicrobiae bacterium]
MLYSRFASLLLLPALAGPVLAADLHVSLLGNDTNPGTASAPFRTIQRAVNAAMPGDTVRVGAGYFDETVRTARNASDSARITLDGQGVARVRQVMLQHTHHSLQNITVSGLAQQFSNLVFVRRGAHSSIISNTVVDAASALQVGGIFWEGPTTRPFGTDAASNCLVISNRITGILANTALHIMGDNNLVVGNYVHDVGQADFVRLWGQANIIRGNTFTNNFPVPGVGNHIDFIQTFGNNRFGSQDHIIEGNRVLRIRSGQLTQLEGNLVPEIRNWTFRNNVFADIDLQASCTIPGVKYYNNVFYRCNSTVNAGAALNFGSRSYNLSNNWVEGTNRAHGAQVLNNIFLDCGQDSLNQGHYGFGLELENVRADYNFISKAGFQALREDTSARAIGDPGGWDNFRWYEPNGYNGGNPGFINAAAYDFRPSPDSPLLGRALRLPGFSHDIVGALRQSAGPWDIGPYRALGARPTPPQNLVVIP